MGLKLWKRTGDGYYSDGDDNAFATAHALNVEGFGSCSHLIIPWDVVRAMMAEGEEKAREAALAKELK